MYDLKEVVLMKHTESNWNMMAKAYEQFTSGSDSYSNTIEWPCIKKMLPNLAQKNILDLGCGTGRFTFLLESEQPAHIVGVDLSVEMLELAKEKAQKVNSIAEFRKSDVSEHFTDEVFDFVFSSTVTHYIADLNSFFNNVNKLLVSKGQCIFSVMNPVYSAQYPIKKDDSFPDDSEWVVRYLDKQERAYIQPWIEYNDAVDDFLSFSYHHTFSDYVNAVIGAGLNIVEVHEPMPPIEWKIKYPERYNNFIETPSYLIINAQKP